MHIFARRRRLRTWSGAGGEWGTIVHDANRGQPELPGGRGLWRLALPMAEQPSADLVASSQPSLGGNGAILAGRLASPEPRFVAYRFHRESSHKEAASGQPLLT